MRLKVACWFFAALTAFLLLGWPVLVGLPPKHAPASLIKQYALHTGIWLAALLLSFLTFTVLVAFVVRQMRQEYLEESADNLKALIEGTLEDHRKKSGAESEPN